MNLASLTCKSCNKVSALELIYHTNTLPSKTFRGFFNCRIIYTCIRLLLRQFTVVWSSLLPN